MISNAAEPHARTDFGAMAELVLARCDVVATFSEQPGRITRTFLSEPMRRLHGVV